MITNRKAVAGGCLASMIMLLSQGGAHADHSSGEAIRQVTGGQDVVLASFWASPPAPNVNYAISIHGSANPLDKAVAVARCDISGCSVAETVLTSFESHEDGRLSIGLVDDFHSIALELTPAGFSLGPGSQQWGCGVGSPNHVFDENKRYVFKNYSWNHYAESQRMEGTGTLDGYAVRPFPFATYSKGTIGTTTVGWNRSGQCDNPIIGSETSD